VLVGPALVVFVGFVIFPVVMAAYYGFFTWQGYGRRRLHRLQNYVTILTDPDFQERSATTSSSS
jgi:ABC-type sugar transport system permease subunit